MGGDTPFNSVQGARNRGPAGNVPLDMVLGPVRGDWSQKLPLGASLSSLPLLNLRLNLWASRWLRWASDETLLSTEKGDSLLATSSPRQNEFGSSYRGLFSEPSPRRSMTHSPIKEALIREPRSELLRLRLVPFSCRVQINTFRGHEGLEGTLY